MISSENILETNKEKIRFPIKKLFTAAFLLILLIMILFGKLFCPHDPYKVDIDKKFMYPSISYPLGTDQLGRCVLSRIISGAKTSVGISLAIGAIIFTLGTFFGFVSGLFPGKIDFLILRLSEFVMTLPAILIIMALCSILGPSIFILTVLLSAIWWGPTARYVRDLVRDIRQKEYIKVARLNGLGIPAIAIHHVFPSIFQKTFALVILKLPSIIISVASYSFLGLGPQAPSSDWGVMISDGRIYMSHYPLLILWPTLAFLVLILCLFSFAKKISKT
jgi:peptide/nickel transport system permease protein